MKKTGDFLKKAREEKGLSIHEIGLSLKINPKILKQIEDGDKDNLPAKTFLRGFVQSYALFLKIEPNEVLKIFSEEMGTTKPSQISLSAGPQIRGNSLDIEDPENKDDLGIKRHTGQNFNKEKFEFKNIGIGIVVFILLLSLIAVRKVVEKYQKEAEVDVTTTEENLKTNNKLELPQQPPPVSIAPPPSEIKPLPAATTPPETAPTTEIKAQGSGTTTPPAPPSSGQKPTVISPNTINTNSAPLSVPPPTNINKPVTAPAPTPPIAIKPTTVSTATPTTPPKPTPPPPALPATAPTVASGTTADAVAPPIPPPKPVEKPKSIELVIEAFETVEIEMTQASGRVEKIKMSPSQIQTVKTLSGVKLNISNGGAVNLIVNGKDMGVPGDLGKPKRVSF